MIPTSAAYKQAMNGPRTFLAQVTVTFRDETVEVWDNSRLMSLSIEEATSDSGTFTVGSAIIGKLSLSVLNQDDAYSELDFIGAVMQVKIGVAITNGTEYMNRGTFTVDTAKADSGAIAITALDNLSKLDVPYHTASDLGYPASLDQIYRDVCTSCGVYPATVGFLNDDFVVQNRPAEDYTCREILSAVATMAGCFAKADQNGEIMLGWYDGLKELWEKTDYDGGTFDASTSYYETGDSLDGGVFDNGSPYYASGDSVDGGSFSDMDDYFHLYSSASQEIDIDDIEITGVEVLITSESEGETTENTYLFGEEGYLISISENPLIQSYDEDMLMAVANKLIGMRFRKFSMSGRSDPAYETGDSGYVSDRKGNSYISILTSISFEINGYEGFTCDAESVLERNMTRYNETARNFTKVVQKTEQMVNEEKTARELAIEQLTNRVNNSSGLFTTIETQSDGSKIFKLHDKPTLEESQIVWTMTAEAWTVSTNGGETPNAGMTVDGDTIVRILTATGINADWINSGTIRAINIVGSTISGAEIVGGTIRTATIEGYVDDNTFNEEIETVLDDIGALQEQSDKKAETWYQSSDPSTAWTTATLKQEHTGDIWYNTSASVQKSYRWNGSAWQEMKTSPPDEVFDEIDGKAQIFVSQPRPPYAAGDLWFNSTTSDIMTCINSRTSGSYTASDWQKRNKYTDDTVANAAQQTANSALNSANSASTLANQAKSAADTANANANQASQMAEAVRQDLAVSGAVEINGGNIKSDTVNAMLVDAGVLVGLVISNGNGTFYVDAQGNLTATKATIKGNIEATGGKVGFLEIQGDTLSSNAILFQDSATDPLFILNGNTSGGIKSAVLSSKGIGFNGRNTSSTGWDITLNTNADSGTSTNYPLLEFDRYESGVRQEYLLLSKNELRKYMTSGDPDFTMSFGSMTIFFVGGDIMMMSASGKKIYINGTPF